MVSSKGISRHVGNIALDFTRLRDEGLRLIQAMSGDVWTDYNLHDPGVTTLEVLCYGLTELGYRTQLLYDAFSSDELMSENFIEEFFFKADDILTSPPVTKLDFENFIEKKHPQVLKAWFSEYPVFVSGNVVEWGYEIAVLLKRHAKYRNLNTDVIQVPFPEANTSLEVIFFDRDNKRLNWKTIAKIAGCKWDRKNSDNFFVFGEANCQVPLILEVIYQNRTQTKSIRVNARVTLSHSMQGREGDTTIELYKDSITKKLESSEFRDAIKHTLEKEQRKTDILKDIKRTLLPHRNLCEDFIVLRVVNEQAVKLDAEIILNDDAPAFSTMLRRIYDHLDDFLLRLVTQSKQESVDKKNVLYGSNLIEEMVKVKGVEAARILTLNLYIDGVPTISLKEAAAFECINLQRFSYYVPKVSREKSRVTFKSAKVGEEAIEVDARGESHSYEPFSISEEFESIAIEKHRDVGDEKSFFDSLEDYRSIQHDFPQNYNLNEDLLNERLPEFLATRTKQFKTYLIFFERIMIDYLHKLHHIMELLSVKQKSEAVANELERLKKYLPEIEHLTLVDENVWREIDSSASDVSIKLKQQNKILDHLLARFASTYTPVTQGTDEVENLRKTLRVKTSILKEIPVITRERGMGLPVNLEGDLWDTDLISGFQKRVYRLLGISDESLRHIQISKSKGNELVGFYIVEHILLVKREATNIANKKFNSAAELLYDYIVYMSKKYEQQPSYSFQLTIVLPNWIISQRDQQNRIENIISEELPAHILPYFHWLNKKNMSEFESCYADWLEALMRLNSNEE